MLTRDVTEGTSPPSAPLAPPRPRWWHASPAGLVVGTTFAALATTASLVPRDWTFQGIASGISAAIGYGVGTGGVAVVRWWRRRGSRGPGALDRVRQRLGRRGRPVAWTLLLAGPAAFLLVALLASAGWQQDLTDLMGVEESTTTGWLRAGPATLVVALVLVARRDPGALEVDPAVWWSPSLPWSKPDRLSEPRGSDVLPVVRWYPVVTFWQVSTDPARAQAPPDGHGHGYGDELVAAWVAVAAPHGWDEQDTARLHEVFER